MRQIQEGLGHETPEEMQMSFIAAFESDCENCSAPVERGQDTVMVDYNKGLVAHAVCPPATRPQPVCSLCWLVHASGQRECE